MGLRVFTRKAKMELLSSDESISELVFSSKPAQHACKLFLEQLKSHNGLTRVELSRFAWDLAAGKVEQGFKYRRESFYRQIRRTLLTLGLIAIEQRFIGPQPQDFVPERSRRRSDIVDKYVAVRQPIPKRPPDGLNLPRLIWTICKKWNDEFCVADNYYGERAESMKAT